MSIRVACVSLQQRQLNKFDEFTAILTQYLNFANDCKAQLIVFPEYATTSLLTIKNDWNYWTEPYTKFLQTAAKKYNLYIVGGTHLTRQDNKYFNTAFFVNPQGKLAVQHKLHITPNERETNQLQETQQIQIFNTRFGQLAILICYDIEFPEAVRVAANAGADIIAVPAFTDDRAGHYRVSLCARARCIENQIYVVHAPLVGNLPSLRNFEQSFSKAGIFSPCDIPFPPCGIIAAGEFNQETCLIGELDFELLHAIRKSGTVTPIKNARPLANYISHTIEF